MWFFVLYFVSERKKGGVSVKTKTMIICALFAAVMCVFSVITMPIGPVPVTLGLFGVMITAVILGSGKAAIATAVFILLGAIGLPVFSGMKGGFSVLIGPTGGYIWSYVLVALLIGFFAVKSYKNKWIAYIAIFTSCLAGIAVCYALGTTQFMIVTGNDLTTSLTLCVLPFIAFDIAKAAAATVAGYSVRRALIKAGLI